MAVLAQVGIGRAFVDISTVIGHSHLGVALRADAHEGSDQVFAREFAVVGRSGAFVDIFIKTV